MEKIEDFLVIYVDRAEGVIETTKRDLYYFPINYPEAPINDFKKEVLPYRVRNTNWLESASKELERIDGLQGVPR